jgi:hypothetical protein
MRVLNELALLAFIFASLRGCSRWFLLSVHLLSRIVSSLQSAGSRPLPPQRRHDLRAGQKRSRRRFDVKGEARELKL